MHASRGSAGDPYKIIRLLCIEVEHISLITLVLYAAAEKEGDASILQEMTRILAFLDAPTAESSDEHGLFPLASLLAILE